MNTATFKIAGMHCDGCAQTVKALLGMEPGVRGVEVSLKDRQARVVYDPRTIGVDRLVRAIESAGYRVAARIT